MSLSPGLVPMTKRGCLSFCGFHHSGGFHHRPTGGFSVLRLGDHDRYILGSLANLWGRREEKSMRNAGWEA